MEYNLTFTISIFSDASDHVCKIHDRNTSDVENKVREFTAYSPVFGQVYYLVTDTSGHIRFFYFFLPRDAMLALYMLWPCVRLSVSVTSRCSTKADKLRTKQTTPHDSPGTLVFRRRKFPGNSTGVTPYGGAKCR